jgi:beta-fructofuranosidase
VRPLFHFTAATGWINDPHGITFRDGRYHVFFQYVPGSLVWQPNCHWGHATGADLFALDEVPIAIAPGDGDGGIWTGSLVTDDAGAARIFYTSTTQPDIGIGRVRVATPEDDHWIGWTKGAFVADAPAGLDIVAYRDPFVRREPDGWRMFLGAGLSDGTATALAYHSTDLETWRYEGVALERSTRETEPVWMGALWECPQIVDVDGRSFMVSSVWDADVLHYAGYATGRYADGRFAADAWGRLTYGPSYYAPSYFVDADGRPCLTFWMRGVDDPDAGWASAHSVPHVLTRTEDRLVASPHPDLERYRTAPVTDGILPGLSGDAVWTPGAGGTLVVNDAAGTEIRLEARGGELSVSANGEHWSLPVGSELRVIVDAGAIEISSREGLFALAAHPRGARYSFEVSAGELTVWPLSR